MPARAFASTQRRKGKKDQISRLLRAAPPPKLPKPAYQHYISVLKTDGEVAQRALAAGNSRAVARHVPASALTTEEKDRLLARYFPDESIDAQVERALAHKWLWRWLRGKDWQRFDATLDKLIKKRVLFDEITYNLAIFGALLNPRDGGIEVAEQALATMKGEERFHPSLLRFLEGFLDSYIELSEVDAAPNGVNLNKAAKTFWSVSVEFKKLRVKGLRNRLASAALEQRREKAVGAAALEGGEAAAEAEDMRWTLALAEGDSPAAPGYQPGHVGKERPRWRARGIHKGCGAPKQRWRKHRRAKG